MGTQVGWGASRGLRGWTGASQNEEGEGVVGVEGTDGRGSQVWDLGVSYRIRSENFTGTDGEGP